MDLKKSRLLVTPTSYGKNDPRLKTELEALVGEVMYNSTTHLGAQTDGATNAMGWMAINDCLAVLRGEAPTHRVA